MISEQRVIFQEVVKIFKAFKEKPSQQLILIQGAPGTGKTIIGMALMQKFMKITGDKKVIFAVAKNKTMLNVINQDFPGKPVVFLPFQSNKAAYDKTSSQSLVVGDEFHRSNDAKYSLNQLFKGKKAKLVILLQDDHQRVLPGENGSSAELHRLMENAKSSRINFHEFKLTTQKRNGLNTAFDLILRNMLFAEENPVDLSKIRTVTITDSLAEINRWLSAKLKLGSAKWLAPYDWEWINQRKWATFGKYHDIIGNETPDIKIGSFEKYWNPDPQKRPDLAVDWMNSEASDSLELVGSIYTAQGLEYDYVGFIWGKDLVWDKLSRAWKINWTAVKDPQFLKHQDKASEELIKNIYYILLSRAKKGMQIYFLDDDTREHVQEIMEQRS